VVSKKAMAAKGKEALGCRETPLANARVSLQNHKKDSSGNQDIQLLQLDKKCY